MKVKKEKKENIIDIILVSIIGFVLISLLIDAITADKTIIDYIAESLGQFWELTIGLFGIFGMVMFLLGVFLKDSITIEQYAIIGFIEFVAITIFFQTRPSIYGKKETN